MSTITPKRTKTLALIVIFVALAIVLNLVGPKIPYPFAPYLFFQFWEIPIVVAFLLIGFRAGVLVSVLNALILFVGGIVTYYLIRSWRWYSVVICLVLIPPAYVVSRNAGTLSSEILVETVSRISVERAQSLSIRLENEERLNEKAWDRPLWGWGGYDRNRVYGDDGEYTSLIDGFWIGTFGVYGFVGLISIGFVLLLPSVAFWRRYRKADWGQPSLAPAAGLVCIIPLYAIDLLMTVKG